GDTEEEYNYDTDSTETESEQLDEPLHSTVETPSLHNDLASWATATNQTHKALNDLLHVLRRHGHRLPKEARSLLDTPKGTLPGQVELCFNVDGVPLFKSSKMCFWPILGQIQNSQPFIVALFYGSSKPDSVEEPSSVMHKPGHFSNVLKVTIVCMDVSDVLQVAYLTKGPTEERRDEVFSQAGYPDHQKQISPLVRAGILCVKQFPLDYMLTYLWRGPDICRLSKAQREQVEKNISQLKGALPAEFSRQPRSMEELDRWKATELRQFVLYTGPLILKDVLPDDQYHHFLCLSVGMTILLDEADGKRESYLGYAHNILEHFVDNSVDFYGPTFPSYNIHSIKH
ncbi:hypothetical protein M9458_051661, partial [Cirrhinus mrigala]